MASSMRRLIIGSGLFIGLCLVSPEVWGANGSTVRYASGTETVEGYLAVPDGQGSFPAIVVIHEWWGLNGWIRRNTEKLADRGYVALAVDLYRGRSTTDAEEARALMRDVPGDRAIRDLMAAVAYLKSRPKVRENRIGTIGWSTGGSYAFTLALMVPDLDACVINYGSLVTAPSSIGKIPCPVLGIFGENDRSIPTMSIRAFEKACRTAGKEVEIHLYPNAGHAFMDENNTQNYRAEATNDAWNQIYAFFRRTLKE